MRPARAGLQIDTGTLFALISAIFMPHFKPISLHWRFSFNTILRHFKPLLRARFDAAANLYCFA